MKKIILALITLMTVTTNINSAQARDLKCVFDKSSDARYDLLELYSNVAFIQWIAGVAASGATRELGIYLPPYLGQIPSEQEYSLKIHRKVDKLAGSSLRSDLISVVELFSPEVFAPLWTQFPTLPIPYQNTKNAYDVAERSMLHGHPDYPTLWDEALKATKVAIQDNLEIFEIANANLTATLAKFDDYRGQSRERIEGAVPCGMVRKIKDKKSVANLLRKVSKYEYIKEMAPLFKQYFKETVENILDKLEK